jgi:hypothetical protein
VYDGTYCIACGVDLTASNDGIMALMAAHSVGKPVFDTIVQVLGMQHHDAEFIKLVLNVCNNLVARRYACRATVYSVSACNQ